MVLITLPVSTKNKKTQTRDLINKHNPQLIPLQLKAKVIIFWNLSHLKSIYQAQFGDNISLSITQEYLKSTMSTFKVFLRVHKNLSHSCSSIEIKTSLFSWRIRENLTLKHEYYIKLFWIMQIHLLSEIYSSKFILNHRFLHR